LARQWRARLRHVCVDEYQDINAAQDAILRALGGQGAAGNRFLVGDVKQSIYRFRLANPRIFQRYESAWRSGGGGGSCPPAAGANGAEPAPAGGQALPLSANFRSREQVLACINAVFADLMGPRLGGVGYDPDAHLRFGAPEARAALSAQALPEPAVETHVLVGAARDARAPEEDSEAPLAELSGTEREARLVADRLRRLHAEGFGVWDDAVAGFRPVRWSDMTILLRAPAAKAETYAKEFARAGIPLEASGSGFFDQLEISDLLSLLCVLDNPLQDLPLLAVLRSPLVGLMCDELALVRLARREGRFWHALHAWHRAARGSATGGPHAAQAAESPAGAAGAVPAAEAWPKIDLFLRRHATWRQQRRQWPLSHQLDAILTDTGYLESLSLEPRGAMRQENVRQLLAMARQFDPFQRQGLGRFLRFVEMHRDLGDDIEPAASTAPDAVRLMSIHRSKGLEFPIVVLADLGKKFNASELSDTVLLDDRLGLCALIRPPRAARFYPSLPYWLAQRELRTQTLAEELRLLYVAMTRARDRLVLVGSTSGKQALETWPRQAAEGQGRHQLLAASSALAWLGPWIVRHVGENSWLANALGQTALVQWTRSEPEPASQPDAPAQRDGCEADAPGPDPAPPDAATAARLIERISFVYPFGAATDHPAKASVSGLRRLAKAVEPDEEAAPLWTGPDLATEWAARAGPARGAGRGPGERQNADGRQGGGAEAGLSPAELGTAHHAFLERVRLDTDLGEAGLRRQAHGLREAGVLTPAELAGLDFEALAAFWKSATGTQILGHAEAVHREIPFTARLGAADVAALGALPPGCVPDGEFIVVQGVIDLAVIEPEAIWILDYKTDRVTDATIGAKVEAYRPQLRLYAWALERIYRKPVTACWLHFLALNRSVRL
jgi:ATP-dependent helicase/nuclease subunit A